MKTYFIGIYTNWNTGRYNLFTVSNRDQIPASCKDLQSIRAKNKKEARNNYLFGQL